MLQSAALGLLLACSTAACTASAGDVGGGPVGEEPPAPLEPPTTPIEAGTPPVPPATCGSPGVAPCAAGAECTAGADCASGVCAGATCAAPSPTDGVRNGDESDVDCGGSSAPKCNAGKACKVHADCASDACPTDKCAASRSCRQHFGGDTCGAGEVDDPQRIHEDCCASIQPDTKPYRVDKYLVTAGRMRTFVEAVGGDVRAWAQANRALLPKEWAASWDASVPATNQDVVQMIGTGQGTAAYWGTPGQANGCYAAGMGGPTYWHPAADLALYSGDKRAWTKDELDTKTLNCAPRALFVAFCAWDGGRLPTYAEWAYAVRGAASEASRPFPWGADTNISAHASYNKNYAWPPPRAGVPLAADGLPVDRAYQVAAPGRFPAGNGPFGHADLLGLVETFVAGNPSGTSLGTGGIRQYAFQEAYYGVVAYGTWYGWGQYVSHYAVGARCARAL